MCKQLCVLILKKKSNPVSATHIPLGVGCPLEHGQLRGHTVQAVPLPAAIVTNTSSNRDGTQCPPPHPWCGVIWCDLSQVLDIHVVATIGRSCVQPPCCVDFFKLETIYFPQKKNSIGFLCDIYLKIRWKGGFYLLCHEHPKKHCFFVVTSRNPYPLSHSDPWVLEGGDVILMSFKAEDSAVSCCLQLDQLWVCAHHHLASLLRVKMGFSLGVRMRP